VRRLALLPLLAAACHQPARTVHLARVTMAADDARRAVDTRVAELGLEHVELSFHPVAGGTDVALERGADPEELFDEQVAVRSYHQPAVVGELGRQGDVTWHLRAFAGNSGGAGEAGLLTQLDAPLWVQGGDRPEPSWRRRVHAGAAAGHVWSGAIRLARVEAIAGVDFQERVMPAPGLVLRTGRRVGVDVAVGATTELSGGDARGLDLGLVAGWPEIARGYVRVGWQSTTGVTTSAGIELGSGSIASIVAQVLVGLAVTAMLVTSEDGMPE
jgi:hypothetical protein